MGWEVAAAVVLLGAFAAMRVFVRLFSIEYEASLATRRAINTSRKRAAAKIRARLQRDREFEEA